MRGIENRNLKANICKIPGKINFMSLPVQFYSLRNKESHLLRIIREKNAPERPIFLMTKHRSLNVQNNFTIFDGNLSKSKSCFFVILKK